VKQLHWSSKSDGEWNAPTTESLLRRSHNPANWIWSDVVKLITVGFNHSLVRDWNGRRV
jgi:hypothetical protein